MNEVTRVLSAIEQGDPHAAEQLLPLVYDELRKLAAQKPVKETPGQTLQATALVHALLDLTESQRALVAARLKPLFFALVGTELLDNLNRLAGTRNRRDRCTRP